MTDKNQVKFFKLCTEVFLWIKSFGDIYKRRVYRLIMRSNPKYDRGKKSETDNQSSSKIFKIGYMFYSFARVYFGA